MVCCLHSEMSKTLTFRGQWKQKWITVLIQVHRLLVKNPYWKSILLGGLIFFQKAMPVSYLKYVCLATGLFGAMQGANSSAVGRFSHNSSDISMVTHHPFLTILVESKPRGCQLNPLQAQTPVFLLVGQKWRGNMGSLTSLLQTFNLYFCFQSHFSHTCLQEPVVANPWGFL